MKLPAANRTGTDVSGSLGRDRGPTFAAAKLIKNQGKGFLGTGITSKDFGVMAQAAMNMTDLQGKRQKQQASIKIAEAKEPLERFGAMERIPTKDLPEDVLSDEQLAQEYVLSSEVMPALYKKFYDETIPQASEGIVTGGFRNDWEAQAREYAAKDIGRVVAQSTAMYERQVLKDQGLDYKSALNKEQFGLARGIAEGMNISDSQKSAMNDEVSSNQERAYISNIMQSGDMQLIDDTINRLEDSGCSQYMSTAQCGAAKNGLKNAFNQAEADMYKAQAEARSMFQSDFNEEIATGRATEADVEYYFNQWQIDRLNPDTINPEQRTRALAKIRSGQAGRLKQSGQITFYNELMNGNVLANPTEPEQQKAIDVGIANDPNMSEDRLLEVIERTSYVPKTVRSSIETNAINGSPKQMNEAVQFYNRIQSSSPILTSGIHNDAKDILDPAASFVRTGMPGDQAMVLSKEILAKAPENIDFNTKTYSSDIKYEDNIKALDNFIQDDEPGFVSSTIGIGGDNSTVAMQSQFESMTEKLYVKYDGNIDLARKVAYNNLRETWGSNETGATVSGAGISDSRRVMQYPPAQEMGWDNPTTDRALGMFSEDRGFQPEKVILHSNSGTANGSKSWSIAVYNEETNEMDIPLDPDTLQPIEWAPGNYAGRLQIEAAEAKAAVIEEYQQKANKKREADSTFGRGKLKKARDDRSTLEKVVDFSIGTSRKMRD